MFEYHAEFCVYVYVRIGQCMCKGAFLRTRMGMRMRMHTLIHVSK